MSEKLYAWLLRLYPSRFREAYGDEALQLFRDRARDERANIPRLRLWVDLLCDLAWSLPREYFHVQPELASYALRLHSEDGPSLVVLADESLGPGALLFGAVLALAVVAAFSALLNHGVKHVPLSALIRPARSAANVLSSRFTPPAPELTASSSQAENLAAGNAESDGHIPSEELRPFEKPSTQPRGAVLVYAKAKLAAAERHLVIVEAAANLKQHYVDANVAQKMADALVQHEKNGDDDATDGRAFADLLTKQMREVSHDRHLEVVYSETPSPDPPVVTPEFYARYRKAMEQTNCTFEPVKILPHNIGYLKFNSFPDPSVCRQVAEDAMEALNHADAVIFDLRDNRGGNPGMVRLIAAYLFDRPQYMYNPREETKQDSWTRSPVPGNRLANEPVYVLTSGNTFSAAEHFSYDLKMLKRATLVGERTAGATDVGIFHRLDDHFGIAIRETGAINPYSEPDWDGIGVRPNVKVKAADAVEAAVKL